MEKTTANSIFHEHKLFLRDNKIIITCFGIMKGEHNIIIYF